MARKKINMAMMNWLIMTMRRWSILSAATPPKRFNTIAGTPLARPIHPKLKGDRVISKISQN